MWTVFLLIAMLRVLSGCSRSISISDMLVMKQSLITSYIQWASNTLSLNYFMFYHFFCFLENKMYLWIVVFRGRMKACSSISHSCLVVRLLVSSWRNFLVNFHLPSVPIVKYRCAALSWSHTVDGFSPHKIQLSIIFWHFFCNWDFNWLFGVCQSCSECSVDSAFSYSYSGSFDRRTCLGFSHRSVSTAILSRSRRANFSWILHFSHLLAGSEIVHSQKCLIERAIFVMTLCADGAMPSPAKCLQNMLNSHIFSFFTIMQSWKSSFDVRIESFAVSSS